MKSIAFFKKIAIFPLTLALLIATAAISVSAAGTDDGVISVITENSVKYFGTEKSDFCTEYVAANGKDGSFLRYENIDINGDGQTGDINTHRIQQVISFIFFLHFCIWEFACK